MELIDNLRLSFRYWIDCNFKSTKKLNHDILASVDKPKISAIVYSSLPIYILPKEHIPCLNQILAII